MRTMRHPIMMRRNPAVITDANAMMISSSSFAEAAWKLGRR